MNASNVINRLRDVAQKIADAERNADTSHLKGAADEIQSIIAHVSGTPEPTDVDGKPWSAGDSTGEAQTAPASDTAAVEPIPALATDTPAASVDETAAPV